MVNKPERRRTNFYDLNDPPPEHQREPEHWSLDKRLPISIIFTLIIQSLAAAWWLSGLASRVSSLDRTLELYEKGQQDNRDAVADLKERTYKLEVSILNIDEHLDEMLQTMKDKSRNKL